MARGDPIIRIRLPEEVKDWVEDQAKRNMRSQSAEVAFALKEKMTAQEAAQKE